MATGPGDPARSGGVLAALGLGRPELRAWALYDWANSAMVTTIVAAVFPIYFGSVACKSLPAGWSSTALFAGVTTVGLAIVAVLAPLLGALADARPIKKRLLGAFLALGVLATAGMFFIGPGDWVLASVLFVLANVGANGSFVFYDALLPHVARPDEVDRVSTSGYALGYLGGGILLALNLAWIQKPEWFGLPSKSDPDPWRATLPTRLAFLSVAAWWAAFSIPLFRRVDEPPVESRAGRSGPLLREAVVQLGSTFAALRRFRPALLMLAAFLIYNDGIGTIIRMATKYGEEIAIPRDSMIAALVVTQFVGIPCAFGFGLLSRRIPARVLIMGCLSVYVIICLLGFFLRTGGDFLRLAVLVATVQGGSQALSRSLFASLIPRHRSGEFFGLFAVFEKFAGLFGPALFGLGIVSTGSVRAALLTIIPFFLVGGVLLLLVDVPAGRAAARAAETGRDGDAG